MEPTVDPGEYDTTINVIGAIRDSGIIFSVIDMYFSAPSIISETSPSLDAFNLRTEKSRARMELGIEKAFLQFHNQDHKDLIEAIFKADIPLSDKELVLVWQFALNNKLFREISIKVFARMYQSGRIGISRDDIAAYLKDFLAGHNALRSSWSEITVNTLSTKYLNFMTKLSFVTEGRAKSFRHIKTSSEALVLFLYFAKLFSHTQNNVLRNDLLPLSFVPTEDIREKIKRLALKGLFDMSFDGSALKVDFKHSYRGIVDVLYR
jgi:Putative inner membrane protein (DUF1819)